MKNSNNWTTAILNLIVAFTLLSCTGSVHDEVVLSFDKDLMPEGIAVDAKSERVFLNSLKKNKIVTANIDGSDSATFIGNTKYGYLSGFGMTIKGDTLYALSNGLIKKANNSVLLLLNIKTNQLIDKYHLHNPSYAYLNDLAISSTNEIFITDSESNKIYKIQRPNKNLDVYLDTEEVAHSNGIAISEDNSKLYLASSKGIRIVDIQTKEILNEPNKEFAGIDGLKFYKNTLIAMESNGVFRYHLNEDGTSITRKEKMIAIGNTFTTTFDISGNTIYFIKNTQIDNFNDSTNQVVDMNKLESLILVKHRID